MDIKEKIKEAEKFRNAAVEAVEELKDCCDVDKDLVALAKENSTAFGCIMQTLKGILEELQKIEELRKAIGFVTVDVLAIRMHVVNISDDLREIQQAQKPVEKVCEWEIKNGEVVGNIHDNPEPPEGENNDC